MFKLFIKSLLPRYLYQKILLFFKPDIAFKSSYENWNIALSKSMSYKDKKIFEKVKASYNQIFSGNGVYERDGKIFYKEIHSQVLLELLEEISKKYHKINILDFGGSFGSVFFQHINHIKSKKYDISWNIVEQKHYVEYAKKNFYKESLNFFYDIDGAVMEGKPNIILLSSTLQYIEDYQQLLKKIISLDSEFIFIDKTPVHQGNESLITIQDVPKHVYGQRITYPVHIFSEKNLINFFAKTYSICNQGNSIKKIYHTSDTEFTFKWYVLNKDRYIITK